MLFREFKNKNYHKFSETGIILVLRSGRTVQKRDAIIITIKILLRNVDTLILSKRLKELKCTHGTENERYAD